MKRAEAVLRYWRWIVMAVCTALFACQSGPSVETEQTENQTALEESTREAGEDGDAGGAQRPTRIILFVGDGMGLPVVAASSYVKGAPLSMLSMSEFGLMATHEYEFVTTDSAASATAIATGEKTHFEGVSVAPGTSRDDEEQPEQRLRTLLEAAEDKGWKTGLVATARITHATPAAFAAHRHNRRQYEDLALDMSMSGVDVLLGGGRDFFANRDDERDLLTEMAGQGYSIAEDAESVRSAATEASRLVGLMHERDMPFAATGERAMELDEMVTSALQVLERDDPEGFVLLVEGSYIDWAGHALNGRQMVEETLDMDRALSGALEYARERSDTLVVVTSDHETGALDLIDEPTADRYLAQLQKNGETVRDTTLPEELDERVREEQATPFEHFEFGDSAAFGPNELEDQRMTTSFGYLSVASRAFWDGQGRYSAVHTPAFVPIFAEGSGATEAAAVRDNADLGRILLAMVDSEGETEEEVEVGDDKAPKNVILLIGDGLGVSSLTAMYYHLGASAIFNMSRAAAVSTHGSDHLVSDSAAAATALATGFRTRNGHLGLAPIQAGGELESVPSVLELAGQSGRKTALVTTAALIDATPAAFYAHVSDTSRDYEIAVQLTNLYQLLGRDHGVDFLAGAGGRAFDDDVLTSFGAQGYSVHEEWGEPSSTQPDLYLFDEDEMGRAAERSRAGGAPTLAEMTNAAVSDLQSGENGFFLMVEGGHIEGAKRDLDRGDRLMAELAEFDAAVAAALAFAEQDGETLVIVTSDQDHTLSVVDDHYGFHRGFCGAVSQCGGPFELQWLDVAAGSIRHGQGFSDREMQAEFGAPAIALQYSWMVQEAARGTEGLSGPASANFVPLFAEGPGAHAFGGFLDQPEIGQWLVDWTASGLSDEP